MNKAKKLVCVVDDDQSVRRALGRLFRSAGYAAETFASAEDYLSREIFEGSICLVLDVRMPGLNGLGLQEALETRGACEQIVFITGDGDVSTATQAMKKGAVDFLTKPFNDEELIEAVKRALERGEEQLRKRTGKDRRRVDVVEKLTPRELKSCVSSSWVFEQTDCLGAAHGGEDDQSSSRPGYAKARCHLRA